MCLPRDEISNSGIGEVVLSHCVSWMSNRQMGLHYMRSPAGYHRYRVGYVFGPDYGYTAFGTLPQPYVMRYNLSPDYRYVYRDNYIYVVDPAIYAITRVLNAVPLIFK